MEEEQESVDTATAGNGTPDTSGMVIDIDTSDAIEMGPVPDGEYSLQILKAEFKQGQGKQGPWQAISLMLDIPGEISADTLYDMIWLPLKDSQEAKRYERTKGEFNKFKQAFGFAPSDSFGLEDLIGREGWAYLTTEEDATYGTRNRVQRYIVGPSDGAVEY